MSHPTRDNAEVAIEGMPPDELAGKIAQMERIYQASMEEHQTESKLWWEVWKSDTPWPTETIVAFLREMIAALARGYQHKAAMLDQVPMIVQREQDRLRIMGRVSALSLFFQHEFPEEFKMGQTQHADSFDVAMGIMLESKR